MLTRHNVYFILLTTWLSFSNILVPGTFDVFKLSEQYGNKIMNVGMGLQQGASFANQAMSQDVQAMAKTFALEQSNIMDSWTNFSLVTSTAQKSAQTFLSQLATSVQNAINQNQTALATQAQSLQNYIESAVSFQNQPMYYLATNCIYFDQLFVNATMYTPTGPNEPVWKNLNQVGDWEYDVITDSFYQFQNLPVFSLVTDPATNKQQLSSYPANENTIFTEYMNKTASYELQCEITLYQVQYPFFVGIQGNRNRWISGNIDSITCSRLVGIYGTSAKEIGAYYAEQGPIEFNAASNALAPQSLSPIEQIATAKVAPLFTLPTDLFATIDPQTPTFVIRIITAPESVQCKIWPKGTTEPTNFTAITTGLDSNLFLYHSIGFMSPGAIAQFKLIQPTDALFSTDAKQTFTNDLAKLLGITPTSKIITGGANSAASILGQLSLGGSLIPPGNVIPLGS